MVCNWIGSGSAMSMEDELERGHLHEIFALEAADASSAAGFAAMMLRRAECEASAVVWLRQEQAHAEGGALYLPGLLDLVAGGSDLVIGILPDPLAVLKAAADLARCPEVGVVVIELWKDPRVLDLTATRRLAMAAQSSGVTALLLRVAGTPAPSAAATRWAVRAVPSVPLEANAPGHAALDVELLRQRGGRAGGRWIMEWNRDEGSFCEIPQSGGRQSGPPPPGIVVSPAVGRTAAARRRSAG
jgi:protein ImuA